MASLPSGRPWFAAVVGTVAALLARGGLDASEDTRVAAAMQLDRPRPGRTRETPAETRVELAGCAAVTAGPAGVGPSVCEVTNDGGLRVWVNADREARVTIESSGVVLGERALPPNSGRLFEVQVRPEAPWLRVAVWRDRGNFVEQPVLAPARAPTTIEKLASERRTDPEGTERRATLLRGDRDADVATRARAAGLIARIRRNRGDLARAKELFTLAIDEDRRAGLVSDLYLDSFALVYTLAVQLRQFAEARAVLADLSHLADAGLASPPHETQAAYYAALVAHEAGDLRAALESYRASREHALRLGEGAHGADVLSQEAVVLLDLGRADEAAALYEEAAPLVLGPDPCAKATFFNNWADLMLQIAETSPGTKAMDAARPLGLAMALLQHDCQDDLLRAYVALGLAQTRLRAGELAGAREALGAAGGLLASSDARGAAQVVNLQAQVALAEGDRAAAWDAYERLASIAESGVLPSYRRHAALGRAELLESAGDAKGAQAAYEEVARLVARDSLLAPLGEGRLGFLEHLSVGAERYVAFLLGRPGGAALAADVARRSIAQMLSSLETVERIRGLGEDERRAWEKRLADYRLERAQIEREARDEWRLSAEERARARDAWRRREERARTSLDEALAAVERTDGAVRKLAAPREGELFLVYFPLGVGRWAGFAIEGAEVVARTWSMEDDGAGGGGGRDGEGRVATNGGAGGGRDGEGRVALNGGAGGGRVAGHGVGGEGGRVAGHGGGGEGGRDGGGRVASRDRGGVVNRDGGVPGNDGGAGGSDSGVAAGGDRGGASAAGAAVLAERFLGPFRAQIERARSVRFFVPPQLHAVDFHALPFREGALFEHVRVAYGLDVRVVGDDEGARAGARALIVADPRGTLPEARGEGALVGASLGARGLGVTLLTAQGAGKATHANVRDELERAETWLFHFAGHAKFEGADGWSGELPLAENGALTVSDVFALGSVPRLVVLSGCETGRASGLGLAHAFVAAGARAAVGATRVIPDLEARAAMRLFYENLPRDAPSAEAATIALQAAQRTLLHDGGAGTAWKSLRVFVP